MKRILSGIVFLMGCVIMQAQTQPIQFDQDGCFSRVIEVKASAKQAFQYSRAFLSSFIKDYQRSVQIEDANVNKIQVNYQFRFMENTKPLSPSVTSYFDAVETGKFTVDCKDNKIRVKLENPTYVYDLIAGSMKLDSHKFGEYWMVSGMVQDKKHFQDMRSNEYLRVILHLMLYINKQVEDEDF